MAEDPEDGSGPGADGERSDPLGDLADRIRERRAGEGVRIGGPDAEDTAADELDELFQSESYDELDDDLWDSLEGEEPDPTDGIETGESPDEHIVPKRAYCETCEYFSEPPEVHCNHAGTTIVEYVDLDNVRVRNCPIVEQRQDLGERDEGGMTQMSFGSQGED